MKNYIFIIVLLFSSISIAQVQNFYISLEGNNKNSGDIKSPFKNIEFAIKKIREDKTNTIFNIWIREGEYYFEKPLVINNNSTKKIKISSYQNEKVVIKGSKQIRLKWVKIKDNLFKAKFETQDSFLQLFVNGKRMTLARFPNKNDTKKGYSGYIYPDNSFSTKSDTFMIYNPLSFSKKDWKTPETGILHAFHNENWGNYQFEIKSINKSTHTIYLGKGGFQVAFQGLGKKSRFFIENIKEELDTVNEWYFDKNEKYLYWIASDSLNLNNSTIEYPILENLIQIIGIQNNPSRNITISNIKFSQTKETFLNIYEIPSKGDWAVHRGGALFMEGTENCKIENCSFVDLGGNAIFVNNFNKNDSISGNLFTDLGESAICLCGSLWLCAGSQKAYPHQIVISDNLIYNIGEFGKQTAGVWFSTAKNITVSHNTIHDVPRAAICINDGTYGGHIIEHNDLYNTVMETGDHGGFNSWGRDEYWCMEQSHGPWQISHEFPHLQHNPHSKSIIRNNRLRDNSGWGIDLDDGSTNYHIYNNLCIGVAIKLREGDLRLVENNIFVNPVNPPGFHVGIENNKDIFRKNIIVTNSKISNNEKDVNFDPGESKGEIYKLILTPIKGKYMSVIDSNLFYNDIGKFYAVITPRIDKWWLPETAKKYTLEEWQNEGYDLHSIFADPLFIDSKKSNYRVAEDSPALKIGFKNFDISQVGTRKKNFDK